MAKMKKESPEQPIEGIYKGYDIRWLREIPEHPDFSFVAEYDTKIKKSN